MRAKGLKAAASWRWVVLRWSRQPPSPGALLVSPSLVLVLVLVLVLGLGLLLGQVLALLVLAVLPYHVAKGMPQASLWCRDTAASAGALHDLKCRAPHGRSDCRPWLGGGVTLPRICCGYCAPAHTCRLRT